MNTKKLVYRGQQLIADRRQRKRCPKCQFFVALGFVILCSFLLLFFLNALPRLSSSNDFLISSASTYEVDGNILLDADLLMHFSEDVVEALENGIPLVIAVELQVFRERLWWRNIIIKESLQLFELRYHPLTDVHEVKNMATGDRYSFNSRKDAMATLGTIRGAQLIEKTMLNHEEQYYVQMRTLLDISHLPTALRQIASLSSSWRLESHWYQWAIVEQTGNRKKVIATENMNLETKFQHKVSKPAPVNVSTSTSTRPATNPPADTSPDTVKEQQE